MMHNGHMLWSTMAWYGVKLTTSAKQKLNELHTLLVHTRSHVNRSKYDFVDRTGYQNSIEIFLIMILLIMVTICCFLKFQHSQLAYIK